MKMQYFSNQFSGHLRPVLFEGNKKNEMMEGYSDNYIKVTAPYQEDLVNQIVEWRL